MVEGGGGDHWVGYRLGKGAWMLRFRLDDEFGVLVNPAMEEFTRQFNGSEAEVEAQADRYDREPGSSCRSPVRLYHIKTERTKH